MVSVPAFQAGYAGSIPVTRSIVWFALCEIPIYPFQVRSVGLRMMRWFSDHEYRHLVRPIIDRWKSRGIRGFPVTITAVTLAAALGLVLHTSWGWHHLYDHVSEKPMYPLPEALVRLFPSMFATAVHLPLWGALLQIALCFAAAESVCGTRLVIVIGLLGHVTATLAGRFFIWLGPKVFTGLPAWIAHVHDNGPSAMTLTLGVLLAWKARSWLLGLALVGFVLSEDLVVPGLTAHEHLVAIAVGTISYFVWTGAPRLQRVFSDLLFHRSAKAALPVE